MEYKSSAPEQVVCPLVDELLPAIDCIVFQDIANGLLKERNMPDRYKEKPNWREICAKCKWHNY